MEYIVSFFAFFIIYFGITYTFSVIKGKFNIKESDSIKQKGKTRNKSTRNSSNSRSNSIIQKDNSEFHRILKNSLVISFVYIIIILILSFFK
ncbi:hypothetical protein DW1_1046 [Proteiniborus sp. DW1]|uniref:hypothetical protein n=1 Tax=Proteiniborus sp. DW1 TaxID=1889883 RepID=UPI00092DFB31|nr:hypothetical protein [Proteiniborus sp. DW1]SCG82642.1 hypothetical protein DW1_1046 [Proteiniborus sp. DW1]